jgi:serine/threonine-protein kinase
MTRLRDTVRDALDQEFELADELGSGGMAVVFRARERSTGRDVAIKVLRPEIARLLGPDRFEREIAILRQLDHPHIVPLLDSGVANDVPFLVMPFIEGPTVRGLVESSPAGMAVRQVVAIAHDVAMALHHAHGMSVVHRDIKPENILLSATGAIVADFGLARAVEVAGGEALSSSGLVVGTPEYTSPEQAQASGRVDHRGDIYALGCVLHEMLTGSPPFGGTAQAVYARHAAEPPPRVRTVRPDVPQWLEALLIDCMAKRPDARPASGAALAARLEGH